MGIQCTKTNMYDHDSTKDGGGSGVIYEQFILFKLVQILTRLL